MNFFEYTSLHSRPSIAAAPFGLDAARNLRRTGSHRSGLMSCDLALDPEREPPIGAHMVTPRRGYTHHGIYAGRGRVVQYGALSRGLRRGPVEQVPLSQFAQGRAIWICLHESRGLDRAQDPNGGKSKAIPKSYSITPRQTSRNAGRGRHAAPRVSSALAALKASVSRGEIR